MERLTLKALFFLILFSSMFSLAATAQTNGEKVAIKEWLIANKNNVTLVSSNEYQQMSPSVRTILDADKQTLVYNQTVTKEDLKAFEQKNNQGNYISFESINGKSTTKNTKLAAEKEHKLLKWLDNNQKSNIKMISRQDYESRPAEERTYIDNLKNKIIYEGAAVTLEEVEAFEQKKH